MIGSAVHKPSLEDEPEIELVFPFPSEAVPLIWEWANESPEKLFDDYGLKTREEFIAEIQRLLKCQYIWGALKNGELVGAVAYLPYNKKVGSLNVCTSSDNFGHRA